MYNSALTLPSDPADALFKKLRHLQLCLHDLQGHIVLLPLGEPEEERGAGGREEGGRRREEGRRKVLEYMREVEESPGQAKLSILLPQQAGHHVPPGQTYGAGEIGGLADTRIPRVQEIPGYHKFGKY